MVYVYDDVVPTIPTSLTGIVKWEPHCGDPKCDGSCNDMLCIAPPRVPAKPEEPKILVKTTPLWQKAIIFGAGAAVGAVSTGFAAYHYYGR
jgi:hypothetical protein